MSDALRAEWTKVRTAPGTVWLLLGLAMLTPALGAASAAAIRCPASGCAADLPRLSLTGVQLGQAVVAVLAVLAIGGEHSTGMMRLTLTAMPRRTAVLTAKAAVLTGIVAPAAAVAVIASLLLGGFLVPGHDLVAAGGPVARAAAGSVLYLVLIALLALGVGTAVRDPAAAIGLVLGLLYVFPILSLVVSDEHWQRHLQQIAPTSAGLAIQATAGLPGLPIQPWAGLGVLAAWAVGALLAGGLLFHARDA